MAEAARMLADEKAVFTVVTEREVRQLLAISDPIERIIRTISIDFRLDENALPQGGSGSTLYDDQMLARMTEALILNESPEPIDYTRRDRFSCNERIARGVFPEYWPSHRRVDLEVNPPWDHDQVQRWFLQNIRVEPGQRTGLDPVQWTRVKRPS